MPNRISKYQIIEELGRGGMGCVYKVFDPQIEIFLALKVLFNSKDQEKQQRFLRETQAMAKLDHPNIVKIYTTGQENQYTFFTMDYIEGVSLRKFLEKAEVNFRLFSQMMVKIGNGIAYAHKQGIIHRDLKPSNIMIDKNGQPYITDFGLAKLTQARHPLGASLTKTGTIMGTPQYMSPEQARGEKVNHLSDIYALGAIFYEMLAVKPMVEGENVNNIIFNVINKEPKLLRQVNNKLSIDLETICHKATEKEVVKRYQSAQCFAEDIERFLNGEFINARPYNIWKRNWKKLKQNTLAILVGAIGIVLVLLGVWVFKNQDNQKINLQLAKVKKWQQKAVKQKNIAKQIEMYIQISAILTKALEISPHNSKVKKNLIDIKKTMGILVKKQKNYLLSFALFKQCKRLGYKQADKLLNELKKEKNQLEKRHRQFIIKIMDKLQRVFIDRYVFKIVKMQKAYVIKILVPYLETGSKLQRLLAIKALGKLGNTYTRFKKKDSVEWLLQRLITFKDKKTIENNQEEVEEIIWALGWLQDSRANKLVYNVRWYTGVNSILWDKTKMPYRWIPLGDEEITKNTKQLVIRGTMKMEKRNYKGAISDYTKAIKLNPKLATAYNNRATAYAHTKEYMKAITDYTAAIKLNPKYSEAYNNKANAYKDLKEYPKAIANYTKAIKLNPRSPEAYNNRAGVYVYIKEYIKAVADFTVAIKLNPKFSKAYSNRANAYQNLKEYAKAIADCTAVIKFNPRFSEAYSNRASAYQNLKEHIKAIADYTKAIELNPRRSSAYSNRARAYQDIKEHAKAMADCRKAIKLNSKSPKAYNDRANIYQVIKEYSKAIADYTTAIELNPKDSEAYNNRATAYAHTKKYTKAIADFTTAIELNPRFSKAYFNRAIAYQDLKKYTKAIVDYSTAIKLNPMSSGAYYNRANIYVYIKEYTKAILDYTKSIKLNPVSPSAYFNRGIIYKIIKQYTKAMADYNQVIKLNPKLPKIYEERGYLYIILKQYQKAYLDFQTFLKLAPHHPTTPKIYAAINYLKRKNLIKLVPK